MLSTAGEKAAYDNACKKLLSNKIILAWIMKSCLQEYRECAIQEIAEKYIEGDLYVSEIPVYPDEETPELIKGLSTEDTTIAEGTVTYDIRFSALIPGTDNRLSLIINVEPQNNYYPGYPIIKRSIYYCCRMVSSQYGTVFTNSHYEKIKKVYNVFICINPPNYRKNTINRYSLKEENMIGNVHEKEENYDLLTNVLRNRCIRLRQEFAHQGNPLSCHASPSGPRSRCTRRICIDGRRLEEHPSCRVC